MTLNTRGKSFLLSAVALGAIAAGFWFANRQRSVSESQRTSEKPPRRKTLQIVCSSADAEISAFCNALCQHLGVDDRAIIDLSKALETSTLLKVLEGCFVIFLISEGEKLGKARQLVRYLRDNQDDLELAFDFVVLGSGDSTRKGFDGCKVSKELNDFLLAAGAARALPFAYVDSAFHPELSRDAWCNRLNSFLMKTSQVRVEIEDTHVLDGRPEQPVVVYGSWAGTSRLLAEETAIVLSKKTKERWRALNAKRIDAEWLSARIGPVVFIICSHTFGEPPPDCNRLFESLVEKQKNFSTAADLSKLRFAILGTGDSLNFNDIYCKAAFDLRKSLLKCRAIEMHKLATADLNRDQFLDFRRWLKLFSREQVKDNVTEQLLERGVTSEQLPDRGIESEQLPDRGAKTEQVTSPLKSVEERALTTSGPEPPPFSRKSSISPITSGIGGEVTRVEAVKVFYATQSGTAERLAGRIANTLGSASLIDIEDFKDHFPPSPSTLHIFVVSTYGDGDPPESAARFWSYLKREPVEDAGSKWLGAPVVLVGCGNSGYPHFNRFVLRLSRRLKNLGGKRLLPVLRLDELDVKNEEVFGNWLKTKLNPLVQKLQEDLSDGTKFSSCLMSSDGSFHLYDGPARLGLATKSATSKGERLFRTTEARVVKAEVIGGDLSVDRPSYKVYISSTVATHAGGNCGLFPPLTQASVKELLAIFSHEGTPAEALRNFRFHFNTDNSAVPQGTTVEAAVRCMTDFSFTPTRRWIEQTLLPLLPAGHPLSSYLQDPEWYRSNIELPMLTLREVLVAAHRDMPIALPLDFLLALPRLAMRQYTIASSISRSSADPPTFGIVVTESSVDREHSSPWAGDVVRSKRLLGRASAFFREVAEMSEPLAVAPFPALPTTSHFDSELYKKPGVWVATGAGIAPFLAFIDERRQQRNWPPTILFYGVRTRDAADFLGGEEICAAVRDGILSQAVFAFSRESEDSHFGVITSAGKDLELKGSELPKPFHVTHALAMEGDSIATVLRQSQSAITLCGSTRMATPALNVIASHLEDFNELKADGRVHMEIW